jgi:hypothetical protein
MMQYLERMRSGGSAGQAYKEHVGKMPQAEQYAPSKMRRFGGALAAAAAAYKNPVAGAALGQQITEAPYRNAINTWQMKGAGLKEQADIENQDTRSQLDYMKAVRQSQLDAEKHGLDVRKTEADEMRARTDQFYRAAQVENFKRQGMKEFTDDKGILWMVDPGNPQNRIPIGPSIEGRKVADQERGTSFQGMNAQTNRIQANTGIGNLNQRGLEFDYRQGQDAIANAARSRGLDISQQSANQTGMNAGSAGFVSPGDQFGAEAMATGEALKQNPDWAGWVNPNGTIKKPEDYDNWGPFNGTPPSLNDPTYVAFLAAVEAAKNKIYGTRRPGIGAPPGGRVQAPNLDGMGQEPIKFGDLPPGNAPLKF